jgi:hypothetical protein
MYGYFNGTYYNYEGGEDILAYGGNYTTANLNTYGYDDTSGELVPPPLVVQTLTKEGVYYEVSEIDIPAEGSRSGNLLSGSRISPKELKRFQGLQVSKILSKKNMENFGFGKINLTK